MTAASDTGSLEHLLTRAVAAGASDVHVTSGHPPLMRLDGDLVPIEGHTVPLTSSWVEAAVSGLLSDAQHDELRVRGDVDLAHAVAGVGRFRMNVFRQRGELAAALRLVPARVFGLDELGAPAIVGGLALRPRGLVLVTGAAGSGKSTTMTAMIDVVNTTLPAHIVTVEDPIEFAHTSKRGLVHQREIGSDTSSFAEALRRVLRQDPDVILIGELRDPESIRTALSAAETGHLVLATLHTQGAAKTVNRLVDAFPSGQKPQIRHQLGDTLQGVVSQVLVPLAQARGRCLATEVLVNTPAVANLIREGDVAQLPSMMQAGQAIGMHTLDQDLARLVAEGVVALHVAQRFAADPSALDGVRVRPRDLDAEAWTAHAGERPIPDGTR